MTGIDVGNRNGQANLLLCDKAGNFYDHPDLTMAGQSGARWVPVDGDDLTPIPEGTKVFFLPGSYAVGWDEKKNRPQLMTDYRAVTAMLQAGYTRTHLPAAAYPAEGPPAYGCHDYLPLWAYAAVGWRDGEMVAGAFRVDPMNHSETQHYDDREIAPRVEAKLDLLPGVGKPGDNRLIRHLAHCALEYHCFAAKNFFMDRWEAPLPTAPACNAACIGCISLQPADCCPASQERINFVPTVDELCGVAVGHLKQVERGIVSFGQGCEGEPLLQADRLADAVAAFRSETEKGTVHLNTNGSLPDGFEKVARAGLDAARFSLNSVVEATYDAYYRPKNYTLADVLDSVKRSVDLGLYTTLNWLVFPGVSDLEEELAAVEALVEQTGLQMIHFRNLSIDPRLYLDALGEDHPFRKTKGIGLRKAAIRLKKKFPKLDLGYFNRPKEDFAEPLTTLELLEGRE